MNTQVKEHNLKAAAMWSGGGRAYNAISQSVVGAIDHCVTRLRPVRGETILDVATGTGLTSRLVARHGATVIGVDIADGMLAAAREFATEENLSIEYRLGDAEALPFADATFDAVVSTFGVMFAPDQARAAAELTRVCRPGGRIAIAAWTPESNAVLLRTVLGPFVSGPPPAIPSPFVWGTQPWMTETFGRDFRMGFEAGTTISRFASAQATWDIYVTGFGPVQSVAASLDAARREAMRQAVMAWVDPFKTGLGITLPLDYLVTVGQHIAP
jgi:SAM-dependent methyltransferase